jgi:tryptophan synthase alpha chain
MTRLASTFTRLRNSMEGAFVPFVMLGDPDGEGSLRVIEQLVDAGADMLELGIPFSDPPGDGPIIQAAARRALAAGTTTAGALDLIRRVREYCTLPISVLCYYNLVLQYDVDRFYREAAMAGVDAVLVADVPLEEASILVTHARRHGVHPVFMVSEVTPDSRLARIAAMGDGYVYVVARVGVTGEQKALSVGLRDLLHRIRAHTTLPLLSGFGISTPAHVRQAIAAGADGVICGSAIVRRLTGDVQLFDHVLTDVRLFAIQMKEATWGRAVASHY